MDTDAMVGFGGKQAWLAVRDGDPAELLDALTLRDLGEVPWRDGIDLAYLTDDRVALTPLLPGAGPAPWLLAVGRWLMRPGTALDVIDLSAVLDTEVQYFASHRVGELHRWQRAVRGTPVRTFGYVGKTGEVTAWYGDPDPAERDAGLPAALSDEVTVLVSEQDVLRVAHAWSVDPTGLDARPAPGPLRLGAAG